MKFFRMLVPALISAFLLTSTAFAAPDKPNLPGVGITKQNCENFRKDPVKALENKKEKIQSMLKEGKITKEKADAITARINVRIHEINEFNKLTIQQKKTKLINDFRTSVENKVKEGKLTKEKANVMLKDYSDKLNKWDGSGYPKVHGKGFKGKGKHDCNDNMKIH